MKHISLLLLTTITFTCHGAASTPAEPDQKPIAHFYTTEKVKDEWHVVSDQFTESTFTADSYEQRTFYAMHMIGKDPEVVQLSHNLLKQNLGFNKGVAIDPRDALKAIQKELFTVCNNKKKSEDEVKLYGHIFHGDIESTATNFFISYFKDSIESHKKPKDTEDCYLMSVHNDPFTSDHHFISITEKTNEYIEQNEWESAAQEFFKQNWRSLGVTFIDKKQLHRHVASINQLAQQSLCTLS